ncbi:2-hydroxyacid dehydrogenase [Pseudoroseicyclus aestuarii]|uniref:Glyoxylate/hydroxypyruvate reductase A n=1 Tax=Pseudoroseicyclus aestuarii TaxID=1795041 RepID=A0A318T5B3_9RHOB|nr:glyoxylate/hydroxypyruvate reductase A [Pseudoroseicyclus aestuarii]PYE82481.1 glyoxylate/hydroxypyruvate reductase A [Pseudoroseicyclus aestuarii]
MIRIFIASKGDRAGLARLFEAELPEAEVITDQAALGAAPCPYIVVGRPDPGTIASVPGVEVVLSLNAGVEHLLASGEVPEGMPIVRMVDDGLAEGMTEWVLAQVFAWHRNILHYLRVQPRAEWVPEKEKLARDRVVTVLGAGALGGRAAETLAALGFETRVWSRSGRDIKGCRAFGAEDLGAAVTGAEVLVNLLPLTAETRDLIDAALLTRLAKGALFVNGARGAHVVEADLIAALDEGRLSCAALDVFRTEPLPGESPLWHHPRILVSPHVAAPTHPGPAVAEMAANIRLHQAGEPMRNTVDRAAGY